MLRSLLWAAGCVTFIAATLPAPFTTLFRAAIARRITAPGTSTLLGSIRGPTGAAICSTVSAVCGMSLLRCWRRLGVRAAVGGHIGLAWWTLSAFATAALTPFIT